MPCPPLPSSQLNDQLLPLPRLFSQLIEQMPALDSPMSSSQPNEQMPASDPPMPSSQLNEQMPSLPSSQLIVRGSPLLLPTTLYDVQAPLGATPPSTLCDEIQAPQLQDHYQPSQRFSGPDLEMLSPPFNFQHPLLAPASPPTSVLSCMKQCASGYTAWMNSTRDLRRMEMNSGAFIFPSKMHKLVRPRWLIPAHT